MENVQILDQDGAERDAEWFVANFGQVSIERAEVATGKVFRVVALRDVEGPATQLVNAIDLAGRPMEGITVVRYWPDAPKLPGWGPPVSQWRKRGVFGQTNMNGDIGFGMGHGDYYFPPAGGQSAVWIADTRGPSDLVTGLGMLGATNHRHVDVFYRLFDLDAPPPEPPAPNEPPEPPAPDEPPEPPITAERWNTLFEKLDRLIALLEKKLGEDG